MPLIPITLPEGMFKNGTPYDRKGRWVDGNLVRWHDGSIRPIGGWVKRQKPAGAGDVDTLIADPTLEAVRDIFSWRDNNQDQNAVFGSNLGLCHLNNAGVVTDITYAGYTASNASKDAQVTAGYGQNPYGVGAYGAANNLVGADPIPPNRWYFDNFGEVLLTGSRNNGGVYELDLSTLTLSAVTNAPSVIQDLCVTDQRQVFTIGAEGEPRRVKSSEIEDRTDWTPRINNQAIDRVLPGTGRLLRCVNVLRQVLILGETDAHVGRYINAPYVYSIDLAGENCGPLAAEAIARTDRFAVWWGERNFWIYDGSVQQLPCDVIDALYDDLDPQQVSKITCFTNTDYSEVWWLYQSLSTTTTEVDSYVVWDYRSNSWNMGRIDRTAGEDKGVLLVPIMVNSAGEIFNHELDDTFPLGEGDVFVKSGPLELGQGEQNMAVRYIYPASEGNTGISYRLYGRQLPNATEYEYGPYTYQREDPIPTRAMGREIAFRIDFTRADNEHGSARFDVAPMNTPRR
jgi:hypothetical protein